MSVQQWPEQWRIGGSHRVDYTDDSLLSCRCGSIISFSWADKRIQEWMQEHAPHFIYQQK